eukprot:TRINITY_DN5521_c0_g1_i1.p1 TRINITY_DN5521_c0_g1~~TRINITY_DN5521_c0_g1_i1.p1  ORF type:complete len:241 (-),score=15.67 TRINITY_DN5521_c0_g1_i1:67-789(-)
MGCNSLKLMCCTSFLPTKQALYIWLMFVLTGAFYINIETFFKAFKGDMVNGTRPNYTSDIVYISLIGWSSVWVFFVAGLLGLLLSLINELFFFRKYIPAFFRWIVGTAIMTIVELGAGLILNVGLGLEIWNYDHLPYNFMGQIALEYVIIWSIIVPAVYWLNDMVRLFVFNFGSYYPLYWAYLDVILFWNPPYKQLDRLFKDDFVSRSSFEEYSYDEENPSDSGITTENYQDEPTSSEFE